MPKRINVILPEETVRVLDRVSSKGNRSRLISTAILYYVSAQGKNHLAERLKAGYQANAQRDIDIAQEWFPLEEEAWRSTAPRPEAKK